MFLVTLKEFPPFDLSAFASDYFWTNDLFTAMYITATYTSCLETYHEHHCCSYAPRGSRRDGMLKFLREKSKGFKEKSFILMISIMFTQILFKKAC